MSTTTATLKVERFTHGLNTLPFDGVQIGNFVIGFRSKGLSETNSYRSKTRVFGACDDLVADLNAIEPKFIPFTDELSSDVARVEEKLWRTWRDTTKKIAGERLVKLLTELAWANLDGYSFPPELTELKFSYKAGCTMCPCSPGFIMGGAVLAGYKPQDIWVTEVSKLTKIEVSA